MLLFSLSSNDLSPLYQARCAATKKLIADHGPNAYLIPSSDHPHIIAGQGSIAVEFLEQVASFFKYQSNQYRLAKAKREAPDYILVIKAINDKLGNSKPVKIRTFKSLLNLSSLLFIFKGEAGWFNNKYDAVRIMQIEVSTDAFSLLQMLLKK